MADRDELVCSAGHLFFFFFCSDGSCKSSFVWSLQEDHCSVAGCCCRTYGVGGWVGLQRGREGWYLRAQNADGLHVHVWQMGDETRGQDLVLVCEFVCSLIEMQSVDYRSSSHKKKNKKNTLTPKGLDTQSSSLKQSNLFIWWFLICCFSASFHRVGLFSIPGSAERSMLRTHPAPAASWALVARDDKGHSESN